MKGLKKLLALGVMTAMAITVSACGANGSASASGNSAQGTRKIIIGSWWRQYYDSSDESIEVSTDWALNQDAEGDDEATLAEKAINREVCQKKWDNVSFLESRYNIEFVWQNLTFAGTRESLNNSVLAGNPDCDIYMVNANIAIPAQSNGLLVDLKTILPEDSDLFTDQTVFSYIDLGDGKACILQVNGGMQNTFPLAFNVQMLEQYNLEDPRELYARGEWTWDKFLEYCEALTLDTDGDGQIDQYGYCGFLNDTFSELLMSNGASIASGPNQTLDSVATGECLQMLQTLYTSKYSIAYDSYDGGGDPSESMRCLQYNEGNIGFFPISVWIQDKNGNYPNGDTGNLTWDIAYVQWPVGPSGNQETNAGYNAADGNFFVIPAGVEDPLMVYNFLYDLYNWYDGDLSVRDNIATVNWWYNSTAKDDTLKAENFEVQRDCLARPGIELYEALGIELDLESLILGNKTPAQIQEEYKQQYQDALDRTFGTN